MFHNKAWLCEIDLNNLIQLIKVQLLNLDYVICSVVVNV